MTLRTDAGSRAGASAALLALALLGACALPPAPPSGPSAVAPPAPPAVDDPPPAPGTTITAVPEPGRDVAIDDEAAPAEGPCPSGLPPGVRCWSGVDRLGSPYRIAVPQGWSGVLVLHAHGGPTLGPPRLARTDEDLQRWAVTLAAGHAWAGAAYRQGGFALTAAADDTERLRRIAVRHLGPPRRTLLHGQSWGAGVAVKAAERYSAGSYDGLLLTSGVLGGATRAYDFRLDLRAVYQALCRNHPLPDEPAYPLGLGLPADSRLTRAELDRRVDDCLGTARPPGQRSAAQAARLRQLAAVIRIPPSSVPAHLAWATWHFQDIALNRTGGAIAFGNEGVRYAGSDDDAALNAAVPRVRRDPHGVQRLRRDADPTGRLPVPTLSLHALRDGTAFVELQSAFAAQVAAAGDSARLAQAYVDLAEHSYWNDAVYRVAFDALLEWVEATAAVAGRPAAAVPGPTAEALQQRCRAWGEDACRLRPLARPGPLEARVPAR